MNFVGQLFFDSWMRNCVHFLFVKLSVRNGVWHSKWVRNQSYLVKWRNIQNVWRNIQNVLWNWLSILLNLCVHAVQRHKFPRNIQRGRPFIFFLHLLFCCLFRFVSGDRQGLASMVIKWEKFVRTVEKRNHIVEFVQERAAQYENVIGRAKGR